MGSAAAVVEISSDDDDDRRTPGAGKHKSPDDALVLASKMLGEGDFDATGEDSSAMQKFLASLLSETNIVVDKKESLVNEYAKKSVRDADKDDDDCVILDGDPDKVVAAAEEEGPRRDASEDELRIVAEKGELACRDFPHPRHLCASLPFSTSSHASHCSMCHCYVCDSPAPCAFWGKGTVLNDHCNATDKDAKWKKLRQLSKRKSQPTPKRGNIQNSYQLSSITPSSQPSANGIMLSTGRFPVSSIVSQNQQVHPSIMVPQDMGQGICLPRVASPMPRATMPSNRSKRARAGPPVYTPPNVNNSHPSVPSYGLLQAAFPRAFQTAQARPRVNISAGTFRSYPVLPLRAPTGSQGHQFEPLSYPQVAPNITVGTGVPLSRCSSLSTQETQHPGGRSADIRRWRDALANLAYELGVPDYNIDPTLGQQSASTPQSLHPNQLAQAKASQGVEVKQSYVAATAQMRPDVPNHASGAVVLSSGSIQTDQPLCQLNSQSSLTLTESAQLSLPWDVDGN